MSDTKAKPKTEAEQLFHNLDKPSLSALSYMLRHPDTWPEGFHWDYGDCGQCAMGLAERLWNFPEMDVASGPSIMAKRFAMPYGAARDIFLGDGDWVPTKTNTRTVGALWWKREVSTDTTDFNAVTPEMVADQIDAYLAKRS